MLDKWNGVLNTLIDFWKVVCKAARYVCDFNSDASNVIDVILRIVVIALAIAWVILGYDKLVINRKSTSRINDLVTRKKYIRGLFVELNESKEYLRYFSNKEKWRERLIREYNALFNDYEGFLLKEAFSSMGLNLELSKDADAVTLSKTIKKTKDFIDGIHNERIVPDERYADSVTRFHRYSNGYEKVLHEMQIKAETMNTNFVVMVGTAGNGKTNMLCSFSELLMKMGKRCVYINGKEITEDVEEYMWKCFGIWQRLDSDTFRSFYLKFLCKTNRELYFIIDAINENDKNLGEQLSSWISRLLRYKNVRILVSCRSEFYQARYKKLLEDDVEYKPVLVDLLDMSYSMEAKHRMFDVYCKAFKYTGNVTSSVKEKLCKQLLTMRIFFELNENGNKDYFDLNIYTLIEDYIKKISVEKEGRVRALLNEIAKKMIEQNSYSEVRYSLLTKVGQEIEEQIEDTMLTSKTFIVDQGRLLSDKELAVQFVYDEVRDYCLARAFLGELKENDKYDDNNVMSILEKLVADDAVCAEGVIKYIYRDAHYARNNDLCGKIISKFDDVIDAKIYRRYNSLNWTLQLILDASDGLLQCENDYITSIIEQPSGHNLSHLFTFLIEQEKNTGVYTLDLILNIIKKKTTSDEISDILWGCIDGWDGQTVGHNNFIEIDKYLEANNISGCIRFREFVTMYNHFLQWEGKEEVEEYLENKDLTSVFNTIKVEYVFVRGKLKNDI